MDQIDDILNQDLDPTETREWVESLNAVINHAGAEGAHCWRGRMVDSHRRSGGYLPFDPTTEYVNTIPPHMEARSPGDAAIEWRICSLIRWNALATVVRANRKPGDLGGHISSFASSATLYDVGFNHFWRATSEEQLDLFRMEVEGKGKGLSSYPHPYLMPDYWQVPTVSMGLGPIQAIYQARFLRYLDHRGIASTEGRKVWAFMGDGEMDEPESRGAISLGSRECLDNL